MGTLSALDSLRTGGHIVHSKGACTPSALDSLRKATQRQPTEPKASEPTAKPTNRTLQRLRKADRPKPRLIITPCFTVDYHSLRSARLLRWTTCSQGVIINPLPFPRPHPTLCVASALRLLCVCVASALRLRCVGVPTGPPGAIGIPTGNPANSN